MEQLDEVIAENLSNESFSISDLEEALQLSSSQIFRKIKQHTGISPSSYIRTLRLEQAHEMITVSDITLSELAYQVGFSSLSYFSKCFSEHFGYAPSSLRASL